MTARVRTRERGGQGVGFRSCLQGVEIKIMPKVMSLCPGAAMQSRVKSHGQANLHKMLSTVFEAGTVCGYRATHIVSQTDEKAQDMRMLARRLVC